MGALPLRAASVWFVFNMLKLGRWNFPLRNEEGVRRVGVKFLIRAERVRRVTGGEAG